MTPRLTPLLALPLLACGGAGPGGQGGGRSEAGLTVYLAQPGVEVGPGRSLTVRRDALEGEDVFACDVGGGPQGPARAVCLTPHQVAGWAGDLELSGVPDVPRGIGPDGNPVPSACGPGRLLAINGFTDTGGPARGGGRFDLADPQPVGGNTALFCEEYAAMRWTGVSVDMTYLDTQVRVPGEHWTVRWMFEPNPILADPEFSAPSCGMDPHYAAALDFLPDPRALLRGDVLVCRQATPDAPCADADFQWLDLDAMTFTSTRPANPYRSSYMMRYAVGQDAQGNFQDVFCNMNCNPGEPYCGFSAGGYDVSFSIPGDRWFRLHSEQLLPEDPRFPATADPMLGPVTWYTFEDAQGGVQEGASDALQVVVRFDTTGLVVLEGIADPEEVEDYSPEALFTHLNLRDMASRGGPHDFGHAAVHTGWVELGLVAAP
jgi:hypothetical protein